MRTTPNSFLLMALTPMASQAILHDGFSQCMQPMVTKLRPTLG